ncbi:MAG: 50S ribosomal protein L11 methyltransferase [Muribaculaceae bacterium]|nr:50S ribosomal protein L11 methyltransferase [Muribaculaceae bacterium]
MNDYRKVTIKVDPCSEVATDILAALLADEGYESFVAEDDGLTAYIKAELFTTDTFGRVAEEYPIDDVILTFNHELVEGRDWNHEWEKNYFQPIVIGGDKCVIHSSFHTGYPECQYDIVIDPKMAFGTGHHSTTSLIIGHLLELDLQARSLLDMGTGTGILAILAAMRGASPVFAIEIDPMAHINAVENVAANGHPEIDVRLGDASLLADLPKVDIMLANINRNIILADLDRYARVLHPGSLLFLSGFYTADASILAEKAATLGLEVKSQRELNDWCCLQLEMKK